MTIADKIVPVAPDATYVIVSNPVDILTYVFLKHTGLPQERVIGSGTILDTARLRCGLAEHFDIAQKNIHAYVFGEHGDTSFVPWSCADISGAKVDEYASLVPFKNIAELDKDAMIEYVRKSGGKIIANKGATFYAIADSVVNICGILLSANESIATISSMMHGEYGIEDVCVSVLCLVGPNGVQGKLPIKLTDEEVDKLRASANALKDVIAQITL